MKRFDASLTHSLLSKLFQILKYKKKLFKWIVGGGVCLILWAHLNDGQS